MNYDKLFIEISEYYKFFPKVEHLKGVASTACKMANIFSPKKSKKAKIAGFLHDVARYLTKKELFEYAKICYKIDEEERRFPILLHGKAAAVIAQNKFSITDREILDAIANHVTGAIPMETLSKIIFIADVIEPNRDFCGVKELRELAFKDLNLAFQRVLANKVVWLIKNRFYVSIKTVNLWNKIIFEEE